MKTKIISTAICAAITSMFAGNVLATNGYSPHGFGAKQKAMGGAGVAVANDSMSVATNPALAVDIDERMDLGLALFSPKRSYTANNNGTPGYPTFEAGEFKSGKEYFPVPHIGYNHVLDRNSAIGIAVGGNGGMNTEYSNAVFAAFNRFPAGHPNNATTPVGVDLKQLFVGFNYARRINEKHSIGIMPVVAVQTFKAYGLEPFMGASTSPGNVTGRGTDTSYGGGLRIGWHGKLNDRLSVGLSYQSRLWMSKFDKYEGLFAEGGDFDIPSTVALGLNFQVTPKVMFAMDYQHVRYSEVNAIGNGHNVPMAGTVLGTDEGIGFGWEDMNIIKLGVAWDFRPDMTFRAGASFANQIVPTDQGLFNILAPAVIRDHWTLGLTKQIDKNNEVNFAFAYMPEEKVCGTNVNTGSQSGCIQMDQFELEVSWGLRF
ncbi:OmpP1/FadL family transporter [Candidatus Venteria ishoeyi]|uniref:Outer membrane protein transport protein (OMPP1/FadL/TodX) n=1 Tax=Candidatus Venteria ishoeyi TaxID=1899563 RepID=A0A1H6FBC9_9GAMM|nr:outer membrane protein transport protein [Candidatus Venteria ishoeyi]SEH06629.1 Outer membrane protein transport protein (OMPP1/FadL/TodX) [Candidatus Venteria ishoeyi]